MKLGNQIMWVLSLLAVLAVVLSSVDAFEGPREAAEDFDKRIFVFHDKEERTCYVFLIPVGEYSSKAELNVTKLIPSHPECRDADVTWIDTKVDEEEIGDRFKRHATKTAPHAKAPARGFDSPTAMRAAKAKATASCRKPGTGRQTAATLQACQERFWPWFFCHWGWYWNGWMWKHGFHCHNCPAWMEFLYPWCV